MIIVKKSLVKLKFHFYRIKKHDNMPHKEVIQNPEGDGLVPENPISRTPADGICKSLALTLFTGC